MPKKPSDRPPVTSSVECEFENQIYRGTYQVNRGLMTVNWRYGSKSATPGSCPGVLAAIILRELVEDAKRKGLLGSNPW